MKPYREWWSLLMEGGFSRYLEDEDYTEGREVKMEKIAHFRQCAPHDMQGCPLQPGRTLVDELQSLNLMQGLLGTPEAPCVGDGSLLPWRQKDLLERHIWSSNDGSSTTAAAWSCRPGDAAGAPGVAAVAAGVAEDRAAGIAWRWMQHQKVEPQGHGGRQVQQMDAAASEVGLSCSHSVLVGSNWRSACAASLQVDVVAEKGPW